MSRTLQACKLLYSSTDTADVPQQLAASLCLSQLSVEVHRQWQMRQPAGRHMQRQQKNLMFVSQ